MEHCGGDKDGFKYVHCTLLFLLFFHLNSVHSLRLLLFFYVFFIFGLCPPPSSYSVQICFCIQRGSFQVEHCGGDEHVSKYVHSSLFLLLVLSLESHSLFFFFFLQFFPTVASNEHCAAVPGCLCMVPTTHFMRLDPVLLGTVVVTRARSWQTQN